MEILTDTALRAHWFRTRKTSYDISGDTVITPAAKDFIKEHNITLNVREGGFRAEPMTVEEIPEEEKSPVYVDLETKEKLTQKPEQMTHLRGNLLVSKEHPQIAFRGMLDSLEAKIMEVQILASESSQSRLVQGLEEALLFVRSILRAEVLDQPVEEMKLLCMDADHIHYESHHIQEIYGIPHPLPDYRMGRICVALNSLRTFVRETELSAVKAFCHEGNCEREDVIQALNRLSSFVYILFCRQYTDQWPGTEKQEYKSRKFPVEASGRHVHLTRQAVQALFGKDDLTKKADLSQPGQYVAAERVKIVTAGGEFDHVAVLGPVRKEVQVELSLTDARILGIDLPVRLSGDLRGAADVILAGPEGIYNAVGSAIASRAHIHMTPEDAADFGVADGDSVSVRLETERPVTLDEVIIRVDRNFSLSMHLDYDEANACSFRKGDTGYIIREF